MSAQDIYNFEEILCDATAAVFTVAGLTALTLGSDPKFQKERPRVEVFFKLAGQTVPIRYAILPDNSKRNAAWHGELSLHVITDADVPGKRVHTAYLSEVRNVCANLGDRLNDNTLKRHKVQQMLEQSTIIGVRSADGYQQSQINFAVDFSVQQDAWPLLTQ